MAPGCIFCAIAAGDAPSVRVFEDDHVVAIMDIRPLVEGHMLVVPRAHCSDLRDCPEAALAPLLDAARRLGAAAVEATDAEGFNLLNTNGAAADQTVFHLHVHVLPRRPGDGFATRSLAQAVAGARVVDHAGLERIAARMRAAIPHG